MKAFKVTTETQEFIVTAYTLAEVVAAYEDCDLRQVVCLGEVVPMRVRSEDTPGDKILASCRIATYSNREAKAIARAFRKYTDSICYGE